MGTMKKITLAAMSLALSAPVAAQTYGPDGPQPVTYSDATGATYVGVLGDGSNARGGTAPAIANQPAAIDTPGVTVADWLETPDAQDRVSSVGTDNKFRILCHAAAEKREDPILFYQQSNVGHGHTFVGNSAAGKDSTYTTLRVSTGTFSCHGGVLNKTAYWEPSLKSTHNGITVTVKPDHHTFYYVVADTLAPRKTELIRELSFIGGMDPSNMANTTRLAEIPAGLAISGGAGILGSGFHGWQCLTPAGATLQTAAGGTYSPALQTEAGGDPWETTCGVGHQLVATLTAPACWDGRNPTSPNGRDHFRYPLRHPNSGQEDICPNGWYQVPTFEAKATYSHNGWADYSKWYLTSDRMSNNPANWLRPGSSFHFDWMNAWDPTILATFQTKCLGIFVVGGPAADPAACQNGTISATQRLKSGPPPVSGMGNNPIIDPTTTYYNDPVTVRYFPLLPGTPGPFSTTHAH